MLDEPEQEYAPSSSGRSSSPRRSSERPETKLRRDYGEDFATGYDDPSQDERPQGSRPRQATLKLKFRARLPKTIFGRIVTGAALLSIAGAGIALLMLARSFLLHDERFMIQSPSAIEIQGNNHLTRDQLLGIFGEDIGRNIFRISLDDRQTELEQLPWVQHAVLMRLLPGRIRVSIVERKPVAFVRQGSHIGFVDATGILLDMSSTPGSEPHYSFPVVTGISATDPISTRSARMKIFERFTTDLDSSGEKVSEVLSEIDLSNPEDVKALIPDHSAEILVHFGDDHFLDRYRKFQEHLPEWHTQYPNLSSVDMRYEREVVLDMAGAKADVKPVPAAAPSQPAKPVAVAPHPAVSHPTPTKAPAKAPAKAKVKPAAKVVPHPPAAAHPSVKASIVAKPDHAVAPASKPAQPPSTPIANHPAATTPPPGNKPAPQAVTKPATQTATQTASASATARSGYLAKPSAGKPLVSPDTYHPPQVAPQ